MKIIILLVALLITSIAFAKDTKLPTKEEKPRVYHPVIYRAWKFEEELKKDLDFNNELKFEGYTCWFDVKITAEERGLIVSCSSLKDVDVIFMTEALCKRETLNDNVSASLTIVGAETVTIYVGCRTVPEV